MLAPRGRGVPRFRAEPRSDLPRCPHGLPGELPRRPPKSRLLFPPDPREGGSAQHRRHGRPIRLGRGDGGQQVDRHVLHHRARDRERGDRIRGPARAEHAEDRPSLHLARHRRDRPGVRRRDGDARTVRSHAARREARDRPGGAAARRPRHHGGQPPLRHGEHESRSPPAWRARRSSDGPPRSAEPRGSDRGGTAPRDRRSTRGRGSEAASRSTGGGFRRSSRSAIRRATDRRRSTSDSVGSGPAPRPASWSTRVASASAPRSSTTSTSSTTGSRSRRSRARRSKQILEDCDPFRRRRSGPPSVPSARRSARLHAGGISHGDLTSSNVLYPGGPDGSPAFLDLSMGSRSPGRRGAGDRPAPRGGGPEGPPRERRASRPRLSGRVLGGEPERGRGRPEAGEGDPGPGPVRLSRSLGVADPTESGHEGGRELLDQVGRDQARPPAATGPDTGLAHPVRA